jgi:cell division septation protein DedD
MTRLLGASDRHERGVSEVLGSVLMTGLVVVAMTVAASAVVPQFTSDTDSARPLVDCEIAYEDELLLTHAGGHSIDTTGPSVVLQDGSGSPTRLPFAVDEGDDDGRFEVDETARLGTLPGRTEVLLVADGAIVCEAIVYPTTPTPTPGTTPTATATPMPTATPTPMPTATPTPSAPAPATPTPSPTPENQPPAADFTADRKGQSSNVDLDGSPSSDSDGAILTYRWDVGNDGSIDYRTETVSSAEVPQGALVRLIVTDDDGATDRTLKYVP